MNALKIQRRYLKEEGRKFGADFVEIPESQWSPERRNAKVRPVKAWRSRGFLVQLWADTNPGCKGRLSINRAELNSIGGWKDGITWDEIQSIKTKLGFGNDWAVEFYPPHGSVVNVANIRHVWLLSGPLGFGWNEEETK